MDRVRRRIGLDRIDNQIQRGRITIAVLDSGISRHPDLEGRCMAFKDFVNERTAIYDDNGHGTHVCGILCGSGELSGGRYRGILPNARLVMGKVLDHNGDGSAESMISGLEWVLYNLRKYDIRLLNISVGIGALRDREKGEQLKRMVERIWDAGVVVICAAGNKGPGENSISAVGGSDKVITVGCFDDFKENCPEENCALYSGRGSRSSVLRKPDLVAPGTNIMSCCHKCFWTGNGYRASYVQKSGTSMSAPIVTGCAALLLQKEPYLGNERIKDRLHYSAENLGLAWNQQGWGMVNVKRLLEI